MSSTPKESRAIHTLPDDMRTITENAIHTMKLSTFAFIAVSSLCTSCINIAPLNKVAPHNIAFEDSEVFIEVGESLRLPVIYTPDDAVRMDIQWLVIHPDIVSVNDGVITGLKKGQAHISCTISNGSYMISDDCNVYVTPASIKSISIEKHNLEMAVGETLEIRYLTSPSYAEKKVVFWTSTDESVVVADQYTSTTGKGSITATGKGTATIILSKEFIPESGSDGYEVYDSCTVTVY